MPSFLSPDARTACFETEAADRFCFGRRFTWSELSIGCSETFGGLVAVVAVGEAVRPVWQLPHFGVAPFFSPHAGHSHESNVPGAAVGAAGAFFSVLVGAAAERLMWQLPHFGVPPFFSPHAGHSHKSKGSWAVKACTGACRAPPMELIKKPFAFGSEHVRHAKRDAKLRHLQEPQTQSSGWVIAALSVGRNWSQMKHWKRRWKFIAEHA